uniref:Uncharacterized protein n=1 Tax=Anguilla anguilla TaxID=7936 RepID=A0A0E9UXX8_ANGAN
MATAEVHRGDEKQRRIGMFCLRPVNNITFTYPARYAHCAQG